MGSVSGTEPTTAELLEKIRSLEAALALTKAPPSSSPPPIPPITPSPSIPPSTRLLHTLLLLSDSALPLGSFAFSSAFESYLSHYPNFAATTSINDSSNSNSNSISNPANTATTRPLPSEILTRFLSLSVHSLATTTLPYIISAYKHLTLHPHTHNNNASNAVDPLKDERLQLLLTKISYLDDTLDASTLCPVARRASIAQGKALLSVWVKSLCPSPPTSKSTTPSPIPSTSTTTSSTNTLITLYKSSRSQFIHTHLPIAHAMVSHAAGLDVHTACYTYLHQHARAVVSAGVRLGVVGPYVAQKVLAGEEVRGMVSGGVEAGWRCWREGGEEKEEEGWEEEEEEGGADGGTKMKREWECGKGGWMGAAQTVPTLDLYQGRHELLYSRVFNT